LDAGGVLRPNAEGPRFVHPPALREFIDETLETFDHLALARGRDYARQGRVRVTRVDEGRIDATVLGSELYAVQVLNGPHGVFYDCSCKAYEREAECKHLAALAFTLRETGARATLSSGPKSDDDDGPVPFVFEKCVLASSVLAWLERSGVEARAGSYVSHYTSLHDWWRNSRRNVGAKGQRAALRLAAPLVEKKLDALRGFVPPEMPGDGTAYAELYAALRRLHMRVRDRAVLLGAPAWPLEAGVLGDHPGFEVDLDTRRWTLRLRERNPYRASGAVPRLFVCSLGGAARTKPTIQGLPDDPDDGSDHDAARAYRGSACDAADVFALQALLAMMLERRDPAIVLLASKLATPVWEAALVEVEAAAPAPVGEREWCFVVGPSYGNGIAVSAFVRKRAKNGNLLRASKAPLDGIFGEAAASETEREIATLLLAASSFSQQARVELGTAPAHALLRHLAAHPRVTIAPPASARSNDPTSGPPATIVATDAVVSMVQESGGEIDALVPRFFGGDVELDPRAILTAKGPFVGSLSGDRIVHVFVPPAARGWAALASENTSAISFPKHAGPRVVAALKPLLASGHARVPADVMGDELLYEPSAGVRVEWGPGAKATIELLIRPHVGAPLVSAGMGSAVFTFEHEGRPAFVTRDFDREHIIVDELANAIDELADPLVWVGAAAATRSVEAAIALGRWLEANPLGLPIEVRIGKPPSVVAIDDLAGEVKIQKKGAWLVLDGALDVHGTKLTLGEVLEAVRLARSFIEAKPGVFLELSREASTKLALLAAATELAESPSSSDGVRIHHGLHAAITEAQSALANVSGLDAMELVGRLERSREGTARAGKSKRARSTPSLLEHGALRAYQHDAVQWMLGLASWAPGCVLADDMGLGKTVQTAAVLRARASLGAQLVVAPASVASNWIAELARFVPSLRLRFVNEEASASFEGLRPGDVVVASYGVVMRRRAAFHAESWSTLVVDEAQYVKNSSAQRSEVVRAVARDFTIALTGTPLENHLGELFNVVDAAIPGLLGSEQVFRERFRRPIESKRGLERLSLLTRLLAPFLLRRTRASVLGDLPAREEITEYVDLSGPERKRYLALRRALEIKLARRDKAGTEAQWKIAILAALLRLRQLACDVRLVDPDFDGDSTKIARVVELATQIAREGSRVLVFSQFTQFLTKIRDALSAAGLRVGYLAGETPTPKRRAIVDEFQSGALDVFCVSLLAGGTGLNLTAASYVIHTDPWWNPAVEEQATSRAHRMGQTQPVTVYRLVSRGTIEEAVLQMHASKRQLAEAVLQGQGSATAVTPAELMALLRFEG